MRTRTFLRLVAPRDKRQRETKLAPRSRSPQSSFPIAAPVGGGRLEPTCSSRLASSYRARMADNCEQQSRATYAIKCSNSPIVLGRFSFISGEGKQSSPWVASNSRPRHERRSRVSRSCAPLTIPQARRRFEALAFSCSKATHASEEQSRRPFSYSHFRRPAIKFDCTPGSGNVSQQVGPLWPPSWQ